MPPEGVHGQKSVGGFRDISWTPMGNKNPPTFPELMKSRGEGGPPLDAIKATGEFCGTDPPARALFHLETAAKLLILLGRILADFPNAR
jgi:hypothetical protein